VVRVKPKVNYKYSLNSMTLEEEKVQKDLGVLVSNDLKPRKHILSICNKANRMTGLVKRCFTKLNKPKVRKIYTAIVRPSLEYGAVVWAPWTKQDKLALENVQKRFLKLSEEELTLSPLEKRREKTDMIETFKLLKHEYNVDHEQFFKLSTNNLRGHSLKLFKPQSNNEHHKQFFSQRIIEQWTS